jgi:signal transduction histidine kinase
VTFVAYLALLMRSARQRAESATERLHESEKRFRININGVLRLVAHDLRNPLTSIMQSVALAQGKPDPERLHKRLDLISRAAQRMDRLIQDLLDVSLIEAGQMKIEREQIPAEVLVREAVEAEMPLASSSGLDIRIDVPVHTEDVWASRDRLRQVFENLIGNAIKFTETGGHITVGAVSRQQEVLFSVADTGCGISSEKLPHVFDRLWTAVPRAGRLGPRLGLAITKGIVEAHGGRLWVKSAAGRGTTFFFTIPKASSNARRTAVTST